MSPQTTRAGCGFSSRKRVRPRTWPRRVGNVRQSGKRVGREHVDVHDLDLAVEARPGVGPEARDVRVALRERELAHLGGAAQRDPHAVVVVAGLEVAVGQHRRDRLGLLVAELLHREDVGLERPRGARRARRGRSSATTGSRSSGEASRSRLLERRRRGPEPELALGGVGRAVRGWPRAPPASAPRRRRRTSSAGGRGRRRRSAPGRTGAAAWPGPSSRTGCTGGAATATGTRAAPAALARATMPGFALRAGARGGRPGGPRSAGRRGRSGSFRGGARSRPASSTRGGSRRSRGGRGRRRSGRRRGCGSPAPPTPGRASARRRRSSPSCQSAPTAGPARAKGSGPTVVTRQVRPSARMKAAPRRPTRRTRSR